MRIEVIYALPQGAERVTLELPEGASVRDAVRRSGLCARHPGILATKLNVGIFGRVVESSQRLRDGDRVEIYRGLPADPKEVRRRRASRPPRRK